MKASFAQQAELAPPAFDHDIHKFHTTDGVLDLATGDFLPPSAAYLNTKTCGFMWNEEGWEQEYSLIVDMFNTLFPEQAIRDVFQALCGLLLSGRTDIKKIFAFCDTLNGNNGKSFAITMLANAMGDYALKAPRNALTTSRGLSGNNASPYEASLDCVRLTFTEEMGDGVMDVNRCKDMASG